MTRTSLLLLLLLVITSLAACAHDEGGTEGQRVAASASRSVELEPRTEVEDFLPMAEVHQPAAPPWEDLDWHEKDDFVAAKLSGDDAASLEARGAFVGGMLLRRTAGLGELTVEAHEVDARQCWLEIRGDEVPRAAAMKLLQGLKESRTTLGFEFRFVNASAGETVIGPMSVSVLAGQVASISILDQIAYVKDFDVQIGVDVSIGDPIVDVLTEGIVVTIRPFADPDGRVEASLEIVTTAVARPIREFTTKLADGSGVTLQLPELRTTTRKAEIVLPATVSGFTLPNIELPRSDDDGGFVTEILRLEGRLTR